MPALRPILVLTGCLCGSLLWQVGAQDPVAAPPEAEAAAEIPSLVTGAGPETSSPSLYPSAGSAAAPSPDFSGPATAPASSFGSPDFSPGHTGAAPDFTSGGSAPPSSAGGSAAGGAASGGAAPAGPAGGTATAGAGSGFLPGPFSSPASTTPTTPNGVAAPASIFGTTALGNGTGLGAGAGTGTAGLGGANTRTPLPSTPNSFTLPGAYGQAPLSFSSGQGRLARPKYVFTATTQFGFDDNILQTPTALQGSPAVKTEVQVSPEIPDRVVYELVPPVGPHPIGVRPPPVYRRVVIKGQEAQFESVLLSPAIPAQERLSSAVARTGAGFEMQVANRRTVFTLDAHVNADYYLSRPDDQTDLNGSINFIFAHRFSSRLQFSTSVNAAYLSQADVRIVSGPTRNVGDYYSLGSKSDLSYQWSKRISTVTSLSLSSLLYENETQKVNNNNSFTLGTEARYLFNPRLTLVLEGRVAKSLYEQSETRNSTTYFLLMGADYAYSRRLSGTVRLGEALRSFDEGGDSKAAPYLETTTAYRFSPTGSLSWSNRFGFEEPQDATSEVLVFRTSVSAVQAFTSRLRGSASIGYIYRVTSYTQNTLLPEITGATYTADLGLDYALTKKLSLSASYSFVSDTSSLEGNDYYRNQLFLGAAYTF